MTVKDINTNLLCFPYLEPIQDKQELIKYALECLKGNYDFSDEIFSADAIYRMCRGIC